LRVLSVGLFVLVILSGLFGQHNPGANFAPTFVWITWWVGFTFCVALVGNVWPLINPWKILFEWTAALFRRLNPKIDLELGALPYPSRLGVWPAVVFYTTFIWIEVVFDGSSVPRYVAFFAVSYSILTWWSMLVFGKDVWLRNGEAFSVFFGVLARFAPTEVRVKTAEFCERCGSACGTDDEEEGCVNCYECFARASPEDRELKLRPPAVGLGRVEPVPPGGVFFVVLVLAGVAFDGLLSTSLWNLWLRDLAPVAPETLGLLALPLFFFAVYLGFVKLVQHFGGGYVPFGHLARAYVYSLVPIAIAYEVAHYYTFLLIQGQGIIRHVSDPFGWERNLFGTGGFTINSRIIGADTVWYSQVALIVVGHVIAVYLAHLVALRLLRDRRLATRSQYPLLALMVLYTIFSLWLMSQNEPVPAETLSQPVPTENTPPLDPAQQPPMPRTT